MNKKAFTLVELLGVIILLSLLMMILVPTISGVIKSGREEADKQLENNIILATKNWATDNKSTLPVNVGGKTKVTIQTLQNEGYIDKKLKLPSTKEELTNAWVCIINITKEGSITKQYDYKYKEDC